MHRRRFLKAGLALPLAGLAGRLLGSRAFAAAALFADSFSRKSTSKGWGRPWFNQRYGMAWGIAKKKGFYDLPAPYTTPPETPGAPVGGAGLYAPNPVLVLDHDVADIDLKSVMGSSNSKARFGLVTRQIDYGQAYVAYVDGTKLVISRFTVNREEVLAQADVPGIEAGKLYWIRFKVSGSGPVSLQASIWRVGRKQPASFLAAATDQDASKLIGKAGMFGFVFMHDGVTNKKARFFVKRLQAQSAQPKVNTPPRITYAFAGRTNNGRTRLVAKSDTPAEVVFHVSADERFKPFTSVAADETFSKAGIAKAWLPGPTPGATVYWRAKAKSKTKKNTVSVTKIRSLKSAANAEGAAIAFGSCTKFYPAMKSMLEAAKLSPLLFAHLGDFGYPEHTEGAALALRKDTFQDRWARMLGRPSMSTLHLSSAWIMLQDDHDYGADNSWRETVKPFTVKAFDQVAGNLGDRTFDIRHGDLHCFFVDTHLNADNPEAPDGSEHSLLGAAQKATLKDAMRASTANLLIFLSPMPFWGAGEGATTWKKAFAAERAELMAFFAGLQDATRRVLICSGNAHAQFIARHPTGTPKDVFEFISSGTDQVDDAIATPITVSDSVIDPLRAKKNVNAFGYVELDPARPNRKITLRAINSETGGNVWDPLVLDL